MSQPTDLRDVFELGCPACGQANELVIMITTLSRVTPEGLNPKAITSGTRHRIAGAPNAAMQALSPISLKRSPMRRKPHWRN